MADEGGTKDLRARNPRRMRESEESDESESEEFVRDSEGERGV